MRESEGWRRWKDEAGREGVRDRGKEAGRG